MYSYDGQGIAGVEALFVTPLLMRRLELASGAYLDRLKQIVLDLERVDTGVAVSNFGGWHSRQNFLEGAAPEIRQLREAVLQAAGDLTYQSVREQYPRCRIKVEFQGGSWANVSRHGDYNKIHNHPGSVWSGVFYVSLGRRNATPLGNGWIEFQDPRPGNIHAQKTSIDPQPGMLLLFPGWLNHYVNPFLGEGERISIAFNTVVQVEPVT